MVPANEGPRNVPREERPVEEAVRFNIMDVARFHDFPMLFPYQADANANILAGDLASSKAGEDTNASPIPGEDQHAGMDRDKWTAKKSFHSLEPLDRDICFGRGGLVNNHIGNKAYRDIAMLYKYEYLNAEDHKGKGVVVREIMGRLHREGFEFVGKDENDGLWYPAPTNKARVKALQTLRALQTQREFAVDRDQMEGSATRKRLRDGSSITYQPSEENHGRLRRHGRSTTHQPSPNTCRQQSRPVAMSAPQVRISACY